MYLLSDTTSRITPAADQGIGSPDDVPIEEAGCPYLAGDKASAKDTDEETDRVEAGCIVDGACEHRWNGTDKQQADEGKPGSKFIAKWAGNRADDKRGCQ